MSNEITARYFNYYHKADIKILPALSRQIEFTPAKEIFRGKIYGSNDKVGSLIYSGKYKNKKAVLKIQFLKPAINEPDIIYAFNEQNRSRLIRLPYLYAADWNARDGYGYLLEEYVDGRPIYQTPLARAADIKKFCRFYQEYKTKAITTPLFPPDRSERLALALTKQRVANWVKIAKAQYNFSPDLPGILEEYGKTIVNNFKSARTHFQHGHLHVDDIYEIKNGHFVLMSNLFWSYRPQWYDATFHLWAGIKSIRDQDIVIDDIISYLDKWLLAYKKLPVCQNDRQFERKFWLNMLERCVGALLVDLRNQHYEKNRKTHIKHLAQLFHGLFHYSLSRF